jgi:hypothetical protein
MGKSKGMSEAVRDTGSLTEDIELASAMVRFTQREERKSLGLRVTLKARLAAVIVTAKEPVEYVTLATRFGHNVGKPLRELEREGRIKHRVSRGLTSGTHREYLPCAAEWPTAVEPVEAKPKKLSQRQKNACAASVEAIKDEYRPWPFYDVKFLPYLKYFDPKMQRRYRRAAEFYGHTVPE